MSAFAAAGEAPFTIGQVAEADRFVHVMDGPALLVVLSELSTTADFLEYLRKKEALFASGLFAFAESELDLLAYYLWNGREFPNPTGGMFRLEPRLWETVSADRSFLAGREENRVSSFWDGLIEYVTDLYLTMQLETGNESPVAEHELLMRVMAAENRFSRRLLTKWILERADRARENYVASLFPSLQEEVLYVLVIGPGAAQADYPTYRADRANHMKLRCIAARAARPDRRYIVGIALDARGVRGSSEDFMYMDTGDWDEDTLRRAEELRQEMKYFVDGVMQVTHLDEAEYPPG